MKFFNTTSIAIVASLMIVTPTVTATPLRLEQKDVEAMDVDGLLGEFDHDPAFRDELIGGKPNVVSKLVGGGIKGALVDKILHRVLRSYGNKLDIDLSGLFDGVIDSEGPNVKTILQSVSRSRRLSKYSDTIEKLGGIEHITTVLDRFGGIKSILGYGKGRSKGKKDDSTKKEGKKSDSTKKNEKKSDSKGKKQKSYKKSR
ncbi:hypothetical protein K7432_006405 [Basidiobolus ranarum]|uniref:Uncharacterized protein n=1 Tax=Basidiobolus ranarum TaxID=34480 RepID=A0ABR2WV04_9FUNG